MVDDRKIVDRVTVEVGSDHRDRAVTTWKRGDSSGKSAIANSTVDREVGAIPIWNHQIEDPITVNIDGVTENGPAPTGYVTCGAYHIAAAPK
jgi:hypothetical protein